MTHDSLHQEHISTWPRQDTVLKFSVGEEEAYEIYDGSERLLLVFSHKGRLFYKAKGKRVHPLSCLDSWQDSRGVLANQAGVWVFSTEERDGFPQLSVATNGRVEANDYAAADLWIQNESHPHTSTFVTVGRTGIALAVLAALGCAAGGAAAFDRAKETVEQFTSSLLEELAKGRF